MPAGKKGVTVLANDLNPDRSAAQTLHPSHTQPSLLRYTFALAFSQFLIKCNAARSLPPPSPPSPLPLLLPSPPLSSPLLLLPHSVRWLQRNVSLNKVSGSVTCSCSDARTFLQRLCSSPPPSDAQGTGSVHVAMNLPASATDFLDVFRGAFEREMWAEQRLPTVHVYAFSASEDPKEDIRQRVTRMLGGDASAAMEMQLHLVRDVAPKKLMVSGVAAAAIVQAVTLLPRCAPVCSCRRGLPTARCSNLQQGTSESAARHRT